MTFGTVMSGKLTAKRQHLKVRLVIVQFTDLALS